MENNNFKPFPFDQLKQKKEPEKTAVAIAYEPGEKAPKTSNSLRKMNSCA